MNGRNFIVRTDDFDPRLSLEDIKPVHEKFLRAGIPFTIAVNNAMGGLREFNQEVIDYVNSTSGWDIQLHGWHHDAYWFMRYPEIYANLVTNIHDTKRDFPKANPTVFYPPWNESSETVKEACQKLGLQVDASGVHMRYWLTWKRRDSNVLFFHWWDKSDVDLLDEVLKEVINHYGNAVR
jgi:peptidoglycan/xylan/chitin deacetylase (PgdA/CDA1 family)